jgi:hypothetical protein
MKVGKGLEIQARALMKPSIGAGFYDKITPEKNRAGLGENRPVNRPDKMALGLLGSHSKKYCRIGHSVETRRFWRLLCGGNCSPSLPRLSGEAHCGPQAAD